MLQVSNNSVIAPLIVNSSGVGLVELQRLIGESGASVFFFDDKARITVLGCRTITVPKKCLKSFENLSTWIKERIYNELK